MDSHTKESSIRLLKELRDAYRGQLDTSVIDEIQTVVTALEEEGTHSSYLTALNWGDHVLELIGKVIRIVTNIIDLMG